MRIPLFMAISTIVTKDRPTKTKITVRLK